jgi:hypothetical protein
MCISDRNDHDKKKPIGHEKVHIQISHSPCARLPQMLFAQQMDE